MTLDNVRSVLRSFPKRVVLWAILFWILPFAAHSINIWNEFTRTPLETPADLRSDLLISLVDTFTLFILALMLDFVFFKAFRKSGLFHE